MIQHDSLRWPSPFRLVVSDILFKVLAEDADLILLGTIGDRLRVHSEWVAPFQLEKKKRQKSWRPGNHQQIGGNVWTYPRSIIQETTASNFPGVFAEIMSSSNAGTDDRHDVPLGSTIPLRDGMRWSESIDRPVLQKRLAWQRGDIYIWLVGQGHPVLKNMTSSIGMIRHPILMGK